MHKFTGNQMLKTTWSLNINTSRTVSQTVGMKSKGYTNAVRTTKFDNISL